MKSKNKLLEKEQHDEYKKLIKTYREWLVAYENLLHAHESLTFSWNPEKPIVSRRGG